MLSLGRRENGGIRNGGERRFLGGQELPRVFQKVKIVMNL